MAHHTDQTERNFTHFLDVDSSIIAADVGDATDDAAQLHFSALLETIRNGIIGADECFEGPYGTRKITYCDHVASGRALNFIEDYIREEVLPVYGNTHSSASQSSLQTTLFRKEARDIIGRCVNASKDNVVLFCGSGATSAVHTLIKIMQFDANNPPLVLIGPYEHHSNILPWREAGAMVITIKEDRSGSNRGVDLDHLKQMLDRHSDVAVKIGTFSAASNVTGILSDTVAIAEVLHAHGAFAFFDFACAGPYIDIDMNPCHKNAAKKDAVFLSSHKFVGGVGGPGILIVNKELMRNRTPSRPGGGTVFFVDETSHRYLSNFVEREEGGTPDVIGSIRAGLAFDLKAALGAHQIHQREEMLCHRVLTAWKTHPRLSILGDLSASRLPIFSFLIRHDGHFLHYNFVASLLNDLFGIAARGGCACAGPYAQNLLGIDKSLSKAFEHELLTKNELIRPGFVRLNFAYFESDAVIDFVINAVLFIADNGWKLLPDYAYIRDSGEWRHRTQMSKMKDRRSLGGISYKSGRFEYESHKKSSPCSPLEYLDQANSLLPRVIDQYPRFMIDQLLIMSEAEKNLRWFTMPSEALEQMHFICQPSVQKSTNLYMSIDPERYQHIEWDSLECLASNGVKSSFEPPISSDNCTTGRCPLLPSRSLVSATVDNADVCGNCYHSHSSTSTGSGECLSCECVHFASLNAGISSSTSLFSKKNQKKKAAYLLDKLVRITTGAMTDFNMTDCWSKDPNVIPDRLLVAVSGGKDSMTLVDILLEIRRRSPVKFEIGACTVDPMTPEYDPRPLIAYFKERNIPYFYEAQPIMDQAKSCMRKGPNAKASICSFCSRMKRGILYATARREGYNVLVMGQHLDDLAESFLMSAFHNGALRTMKANYHVAEGDIRVCRPMVYIRERLTREYAKLAELPVIFENCPACFEAPKERQRIKIMLAAQEHVHPNLFSSLVRCMKPLIRLENRVFDEENNSHDASVLRFDRRST